MGRKSSNPAEAPAPAPAAAAVPNSSKSAAGRKSSTTTTTTTTKSMRPDGEPLDQSEVNRIVRESLTRLRQGDLFVHGLDQDCYGKLVTSSAGGGGGGGGGGGKGEDADAASADERKGLANIMSRFLSIVAMSLVKAEGIAEADMRWSKRKKLYIKALKVGRANVEEQIRKFETEQAARGAAGGGEERTEDKRAVSASLSRLEKSSPAATVAAVSEEKTSLSPPPRAEKPAQSVERRNGDNGGGRSAGSVRANGAKDDDDGGEELPLTTRDPVGGTLGADRAAGVIDDDDAEKGKKKKRKAKEEEDDENEDENEDEDAATHDGSAASHSHRRLKKKYSSPSKKKKRKHHHKEKGKDKKKTKTKIKEEAGGKGAKQKRRHSSAKNGGLDSDDDDVGGIGETSDEELGDDVDEGGKGTSGSAWKKYMEAKEAFESEKEEITRMIPKDVKTSFRKLCFVLWSKSWLPAIELGPYDVAPGSVRDQWMKMFKNVRKSKRQPTRLVYWYGTTKEEMGSAFSFVQPGTIVSYEKGLDQNLDKLPLKLQRKIENKKPISKSEQHHQRALEEIKEEAELDPNDRVKWMMDWEELHETFKPGPTSGIVESEGTLVDNGDDDDDEPVESVDDSSSKKSKKRKKRKRGGEGQDEDKSRKKSKKRRKAKDLDGDESEEEDLKSERRKKEKEEEFTAEESKEEKVKEEEFKEDKLEVEIPKEVEPTKDKSSEEAKVSEENNDAIGVDDKDTKGDGDMDDRLIEADLKSDAGELRSPKEKSERGNDKAVLHKRKKGSKANDEKKKSHKDHSARKKDRDKQRKLEKKKGSKEEHSRNGGSGVDGDPHAEEQKRFEECERLFLPILRRLEMAIDTVDAKLAEECLKNLHGSIGSITPSFVREHAIGMAIKRTRKALDGDSGIKSLCHGLTKNMKRVYLAKEKLVPKDFQPIKSSVEEENGAAAPDDTTESPCPVDAEEDGARGDAVAPADDEVVKKDERKADEPLPLPPVTKKNEAQSSKRPKQESLSPRRPQDVAIMTLPDRPVPKKSTSKSQRATTPPPGSSAATEQGALVEQSKTAPKSVRKAGFSLKGMFEKPKRPVRVEVDGIASAADRASSFAANNSVGRLAQKAKRELPKWLTTSLSSNGRDESMFPPSSQSEGRRALALEVISDAVRTLPAGEDSIDGTALARGLEGAIHDYSQLYSGLAKSGVVGGMEIGAFDRVVEVYWEKVQDISAALAGSRDSGSLYRGLVDGEYNTPMEVVKLKRKLLIPSFEGIFPFS